MRDRIVHYARRLEGLSTAELSRGAKKLVSIERRRTAALIGSVFVWARARCGAEPRWPTSRDGFHKCSSTSSRGS